MAVLGLLLLLQEPPATVTGTVRLGHRAPPTRKMNVKYQEPGVRLLYPDGLPIDALVVDEDLRMAWVLVYVKQGAPASQASPPGNPVTLQYQGLQLRPRVATLRTGQELVVTNRDSTLHNIHVMPFENKETNAGLPQSGKSHRRSFEKAEVGIQTKCDVHPWESSRVHVFDHPFYSLTGPDGRFSIAGLLPGRYTLEVWHERCKRREVEIEVKAGESRTLDLYLETEEGPPPFPWLKVGLGGGAVLVLALAVLVLMGRRRTDARLPRASA